jgi:hypothetical protein
MTTHRHLDGLSASRQQTGVGSGNTAEQPLCVRAPRDAIHFYTTFGGG